jgi:hypothetical protein
MGSSAVTAALRYVHCSNCGGNALHSHVPCTVYLTTQARILHVDWLVAGRNRYRSTSTIASTAAALVVESTVPSGTVQYSTVLYTQRSVSGHHTSPSRYRNNSERIRSMATDILTTSELVL